MFSDSTFFICMSWMDGEKGAAGVFSDSTSFICMSRRDGEKRAVASGRTPCHIAAIGSESEEPPGGVTISTLYRKCEVPGMYGKGDQD